MLLQIYYYCVMFILLMLFSVWIGRQHTKSWKDAVVLTRDFYISLIIATTLMFVVVIVVSTVLLSVLYVMFVYIPKFLGLI